MVFSESEAMSALILPLNRSQQYYLRVAMLVRPNTNKTYSQCSEHTLGIDGTRLDLYRPIGLMASQLTALSHYVEFHGFTY